ncbi:uncharacterized protein LOC118648791 [Monomorium pharaonis]|uniref:uncharacterized protein LOC118648791 n=1 Tax=Monomorium pharaonis TaxID=307658 RepID=UPI001745CD27|nr:uncharacterized protein LOC118648791 [Monomorium pharaonis]
MSSYFIKIEKQKGGEQLLKIDPTKLKIIPGAGSTATIPNNTTSSTINIEKQEKPEFDKNLDPSLLSQNVLCTPSIFPRLLSESTSPVVQGLDNCKVFRLVDLNTTTTSGPQSAIPSTITSELPFFTVPSTVTLSQSSTDDMDNMGGSCPKKLKMEKCSSSAEGVSKENWTEAEIQLLLEQRLNMNHKFENPNTRKTPYWNIIVKSFQEKGYNVKASDLINKWKNLQVTYNRNVSKLKRTGESAITWKYFEQMHEIFAEKKSVNPVEASLGSTFKPKTLTLSEDESTDVCKENIDVKENILPKERKREQSKKTRFQEEMLQLLKEPLVRRKCD